MVRKRFPGRQLAAVWVGALLIEAVLVWAFRRIPDARTFIPLSVTDNPRVFEWAPEDAPRWFHTDDPTVPEAAYFREAIQPEIDASAATFEQQLAIMDWVRRQAVVADSTQAIPGDPISVQQAMLEGVPAQCENFSTLYVAAVTSMGLPNVRAWHFVSGDGWNRFGHIANDVWVPELGRWVMVDPMNNAYVLVDGAPGSIIDVREALLTGHAERLEVVVGPNAHTSPERLLDLYEQTMPIVRMEAAHTPLRDSYRQTPADRLIQLLPDAGGLPDDAIRLVSGEARHVVLIDDLSGEQAHQLPIRQAKGVFWAMVGLGVFILSVGMLLAWLSIRRLLDRRRQPPA